MALPWAAIIPAVSSLAGGLIGSFGAKKARKRAEAREDTAIARRVADANKAGVHPLYALGAQVQPGPSFNVGAPLGEALSEMGQNVGRAMSANASGAVRAGAIEKLTIENMGLQNDLLRSQIGRLNSAQLGPSRPDLFTLGGGEKLPVDISRTPGQVLETEYGEIGGGAMALPHAAEDVERSVISWLVRNGYVPSGTSDIIGGLASGLLQGTRKVVSPLRGSVR